MKWSLAEKVRLCVREALCSNESDLALVKNLYKCMQQLKYVICHGLFNLFLAAASESSVSHVCFYHCNFQAVATV